MELYKQLRLSLKKNNKPMSSPRSIKYIDDGSPIVDTAATISFSLPDEPDHPNVKIKRYPNFPEQPPLLFVSVGAVFAWMEYCLPNDEPSSHDGLPSSA